MNLVDILKGKTALSLSIHEHGLCVLGLSGGYGLSAECLVRLVGSGTTFIVTKDHGHQFGLPAPCDAAGEIEESIKGRVIDRASIREDTGDLTLHFGADILEIICDSACYEAYNLRGPDNLIIVVHGGREAPNHAAEPRSPGRAGSP